MFQLLNLYSLTLSLYSHFQDILYLCEWFMKTHLLKIQKKSPPAPLKKNNNNKKQKQTNKRKENKHSTTRSTDTMESKQSSEIKTFTDFYSRTFYKKISFFVQSK